MKVLINWLFLILVLTINALANILPINGMNTGQISAFYPNYFVPAGFTFSIWGIIYLLLITYNVAFTYYTLSPEKNKLVTAYINSINPLFLFTCLLNCSWILAWHYLQPLLSILIMLFFLITLVLIFLRSLPFIYSFSSYNRLLLHTPFVVYLGWISVATIANITAGLVKWQWSGLGISPTAWSSMMMIIAILLGLFFTIRYAVSSYALVLAWALWGIHEAQSIHGPLLKWIPITGISLLLITVLYNFLTTKRKALA